MGGGGTQHYGELDVGWRDAAVVSAGRAIAAVRRYRHPHYAGFVVAYPINWWLVANHLKHGMMTVRPASAGAAHDHAAQAAVSGMSHEGVSGMSHEGSHTPMAMGEGQAPSPPVPVMTLLSFLILAAGATIAFLLRPL